MERSADRGSPFSALEILHVEDCRIQRHLIARMAAALDADITLQTAGNLADALTLCAGRSFDAVLLDLMLPDSNGVETLRRLHAALPRVPIIVLTATDDRALALDLLARGAQDYLLKKQIDGSSLLRSIRYAIERKRIAIQLEQETARLRESERRLSWLFEQSPVPLYEFDIGPGLPDLEALASTELDAAARERAAVDFLGHIRIVAANRAALALSRAQSVTDFGHIGDLIPPASLPAFGAAFACLAKGESPAEHDAAARRLDGEERIVRLGYALVVDEKQHTHRVLISAVDLTELRRAEAAVLRKEARFRNLVNSYRAGVLILRRDEETGDFVCEQANAAAETLAGAVADGLGQRSLATILPQFAQPEVMDALQSVLATGCPAVIRELRSAPGVHPAWLELYIYQLATREIALVCTDISERKEAELQTRLRSVALESTAYAVVITDVAGCILWVNPAFSALTGYPREEAIGANPRVLKSGTHDPGFYRTMWQRLRAGQIWEGDIVNRRKDGTLYSEHMTITPVRADGNAITHYIAIKFDISERKALEAKLMQSQKLESIGQLAAGVAHEINTPIQFIGDNLRFIKDAFAEILPQMARLGHDARIAAAAGRSAEPPLGDLDVDYFREELPRAIQDSLEGVEHVAKIVRSMKAFAHPGTSELTSVDINSVIENAVTISRNEWKYVADLKLELAADLPLVPGLPGELGQVLLNMIVNAGQAIATALGERPQSKGSITISTALKESAVEIRVADSGCGIPPEHRAKVFDLFFTTKDVGKGSGQGLAIAYSVITEQHGGSLTFESEVGRGTTFIVELPLMRRIVAAEPLPVA